MQKLLVLAVAGSFAFGGAALAAETQKVTLAVSGAV